MLLSGIRDIEKSGSIYLGTGLLNQEEENQRVYFVTNEERLTAEEWVQFRALNNIIFHRVCDLAEYWSDDDQEDHRDVNEGKHDESTMCWVCVSKLMQLRQYDE